MSKVSADIVEADIREKQAVKKEFVLGLATGNSPTGLYKHLAKAFNGGRIDSSRIRSFNLDEYVGLPGENAQQRALNCESYGYFMISEFFGLLQKKFIETNVPWGTLVEQADLVDAIEKNGDQYEMQGADKGKAVVIKKNAAGILKMIRQDILEAYEKRSNRLAGLTCRLSVSAEEVTLRFMKAAFPSKAIRCSW